MFAGNCTQDIHFYEHKNFVRAVTWGAVMAFMSHVHPDFEAVFALLAVNGELPTFHASAEHL